MTTFIPEGACHCYFLLRSGFSKLYNHLLLNLHGENPIDRLLRVLEHVGTKGILFSRCLSTVICENIYVTYKQFLEFPCQFIIFFKMKCVKKQE